MNSLDAGIELGRRCKNRQGVFVLRQRQRRETHHRHSCKSDQFIDESPIQVLHKYLSSVLGSNVVGHKEVP